MLRIVQFVDHEDHRARGTAEFGGKFGVERKQPVLSVDNEENDVGTLERVVRRAMRRLGEIRIRGGADAARVDDAEGRSAEIANGLDAVARHAGLVVHDGNAAPGETVEEGRLPDVGTPDENGLLHSALAAPPMACMPRQM